MTEVNSSSPQRPSSRPNPLPFTPPHGAVIKAGCAQFVHTIPARNDLDNLLQRSESAENTAAANPYSVSFAVSTPSSSVENSYKLKIEWH